MDNNRTDLLGMEIVLLEKPGMATTTLRVRLLQLLHPSLVKVT
jgi:hypothetical protein